MFSSSLSEPLLESVNELEGERNKMMSIFFYLDQTSESTTAEVTIIVKQPADKTNKYKSTVWKWFSALNWFNRIDSEATRCFCGKKKEMIQASSLSWLWIYFRTNIHNHISYLLLSRHTLWEEGLLRLMSSLGQLYWNSDHRKTETQANVEDLS